MRSIFLLPLFLLLFQSSSIAQIFNPVKWEYEAKAIDDENYELVFQAKIDAGWAIYSQYLENDDGPVRTAFVFDEGEHFALNGKNEETGGRKEGFDKLFDMNVIKFTKKADFKQKVKITDFSKPITGYLEFMTCDETKCLPPKQIDFEFKFDAPKTGSVEKPKEKLKSPPKNIETVEAVAEQVNKAKAEKAKDLGAGQSDKVAGGSGAGKSKKEKFHDTRNAKYSVDGQGQIFDPVDWTATIVDKGAGEYELLFKAKIDKGWHIYSRYLGEGDAIPTEFFFDEAEHYTLIGKGKEESPKVVKEYDEGFEMDLVKLKESATFYQTIKTSDPNKAISGFLGFAVCDHMGCLPPEDIPFKVMPGASSILLGDDAEDLVAGNGQAGFNNYGSLSAAKIIGNEIDQAVPAIQATYKEPLGDCGAEAVARDQNLLFTFILGFLGGLVALLTPCVWPMIPLTVSFFTKGSKDRASGIRNGLAYGASIIAIYVGLGLLITAIFGPTALNILSTHWIPNLLFFALFILFAISFFGYFEITLPSALANKSDAMAEKGGFLGTFFMAATLSIVSFSCTGPIIGSALVTAGKTALGPAVIMLGFSTALALPFGLFAAFPAWLNSLPKSGSWMTSVKVVLGFVELALALKFLSVADMTMHWGILKYETFMALWVLIALATAAYLFGFIRFPHDSPLKKLPPLRGALALVFLGFAGYLATGFMTNDRGGYNALSLMSGLAPPASYNLFKPAPEVDASIKKEYLTYTKCANNLNCFKDYYEGMDFAQKNDMPVLLDFTGYGCVNCRKTEEHIWVDARVWDKLDQDFVLISLYVDDREALETTLVSKNTSDRIRNIGNKWADFQIVNFEQNSQPLYVMVTPDEKVLAAPRGYVDDLSGYIDFLECGLETFDAVYKKKLGMR